MAIKFEKLRPGMVLYDRHRYRCGNTTMTKLGEWPVEIQSTDAESRTAAVSWNGNRSEIWSARRLQKLYTWRLADRRTKRGGR